MDRISIEDDEHCDLVAPRIVSRTRRLSFSISHRAVKIVSLVLVLGLGVFTYRFSRKDRAHAAIQIQPVQTDSVEDVTSLAYVQPWEARFLHNHPLAVCNDGSPGTYYYRSGAPNSQTWVVFLEGAGWCWSEKSCSAPWHLKLGTSQNFPKTEKGIAAWARSLEGIFDSSGRSPIKDMNIAFVRTCSNDAFMGNTGPTTTPGTPGRSWHFRGSSIVEAVFADLRAKNGLGQHSSHRVIYGGCSSGARGAMVSMDYVADNFVGKASLVGLLDSAVWIPIDPLAPNMVPFAEQTKEFVPFTNATSMIYGDCANTYTGQDSWKCIMGKYRLKTMKSPYFLTQSQYDLFSVSMNAIGHFAPFVPLNPSQKDFAEKYRRQLVRALPSPSAGSGVTVYSTACYTHCSLSSHILYTIQADGVGLYHVLQQWLTATNPALQTGYIVDRCVGFNCGKRKHVVVKTQAPSSGQEGSSWGHNLWHMVKWRR